MKKANTPATPQKTLPQKESTYFKNVLKFYETKQYKKGLKTAELILKNYPEHGETLAMKGLILNCMDRKKEAYDFVKRGLKNDLRSHICWHVLGLLYRSDRNYTEAIKCYMNALKHDKKNLQILRDLSLLQVQMRDVKGFLETRKEIFQLKPNNRANWIAFALAAHLAGEFTQGLRILDSYEKATLEKPKQPDFETSEMLLYKNMLLEEQKDYEHALHHINEIESNVLDKLALREKRGEFLLKLERYQEAEKVFRDLLSVNSENVNYHRGFQRAALSNSQVSGQDLLQEQKEKLDSVYEVLAESHPKATCVKYFQLTFTSGERFRDKFTKYAIWGIRKGVPSLFVSVKIFYKESDKVEIIENQLLSFYDSLKKSPSTFPGQETKETPLSLLWTLYFLAQHYDVRNDHTKALQYIDEAIAHTPTAIELYLCKGRIYKHLGDLSKAAELFDKARKLDLADRYLNTKCTLYFLRANMIEQADKTISLFTKEGDSSSQNNLFDMQCMWYEQECGDSHYRLGQYGKALKKYKAIDKHFADITEDQFDFHTYCLRKITLRAYIHLLRFEDKLYGHKNFFKAARGIIQCYLKKYDLPAQQATKTEDEEFANLTAKEKRKASSKKRKAEAKAKKDAEQAKVAAAQQQSNPKDKKKAKPVPVDEDPDGEALWNIDDPLGEATKFLKLILLHCSQNLESHLLACEVYFRKKKFLLILQAIKKASRLASTNPEVHRNKIRLYHAVSGTSVHQQVKRVLDSEAENILGKHHGNLSQVNDEFLENNKDSYPHRVVGAEMMFYLDPSTKQNALNLILDTSGTGCTHHFCSTVYETIKHTFQDSNTAEEYKTKCHALFPGATIFAPKSTESTVPNEEELNGE